MIELSPARSLLLRIPNLPVFSPQNKIIALSVASCMAGVSIMAFHIPELIAEEVVGLLGHVSSSAGHLLPVVGGALQALLYTVECYVVPTVAAVWSVAEFFMLKKKQKQSTKVMIENVEPLQRALYHLVFDKFYFCSKCNHARFCIFSNAQLFQNMITKAFDDMNIDFRRLQKKAHTYFVMRRKTQEITRAQFAEAKIDFDLWDYPEEEVEPEPVKAVKERVLA